MRLETVPLIIAAFCGLLGLGLLVDAWTPDEIIVKRERRRSPRVARSRGGEAMIGLGVIAMAVAVAGRDTWRYTVVAVIVALVLMVFGLVASRRYLGQAISHRGALRRRPPTEV